MRANFLGMTMPDVRLDLRACLLKLTRRHELQKVLRRNCGSQ